MFRADSAPPSPGSGISHLKGAGKPGPRRKDSHNKFPAAPTIRRTNVGAANLRETVVIAPNGAIGVSISSCLALNFVWSECLEQGAARRTHLSYL